MAGTRGGGGDIPRTKVVCRYAVCAAEFWTGLRGSKPKNTVCPECRTHIQLAQKSQTKRTT